MLGRAARLFLAGCMALPVAAFSQAPSKVAWTVILTPQSSPLQLGQCSRLDLTINDPATRDRARNPARDYVRSTDFDFTASTPGGAAVVTYSGESVYACACLAGTPGTSLTATATYPRQGIAAGRRAPGVELEKSVDIPLVPSKGQYDTPECKALASRPDPRTAPTVLAGEPPGRRVTAPTPAAAQPIATAPALESTKPAPVATAPGVPSLTKKSVTTPPLSLATLAKRSITTPPLSLATQAKRSITTPPLSLATLAKRCLLYTSPSPRDS